MPMQFSLSSHIELPVRELFLFLRDKEKSFPIEGTAVKSLEKLTEGEPAAGTLYREVVRMLPFYEGVIDSKLTRIESDHLIEEHWRGPAMEGELRYRLEPEGSGTRLTQEQSLRCRGWLIALAPFIWLIFGIQLRRRMQFMRAYLESGSD